MSIEGTQQHGRTRWQEYVISKAYFLENERNRLCERECKSPETAIHVKAATTGHLKAARRAAGLTEAGDTDLRLARRRRLVDAWTGASVGGPSSTFMPQRSCWPTCTRRRTSTRASPTS